MRAVFIGASQFGFECIKAIEEIKEIKIVGIISNEQKFSISYNKEGVNNVLYKNFEHYSTENSIPFYRLKENMKEEGIGKFLENTSPDLIIVIGWYHLIPKELLGMYIFTGLHASLLPDYSGGAPLVWAIINGEQKTGVTYFYFDEGIDSGDIIAQVEVTIDANDNIKTLYTKVEEVSKALLLKYLPLLAINKAPRIKQDESKRRVFPQRKPADGVINWEWSSKRINDFIRAQTKPYPGAFTINNNKKVIIWDAEIEDYNE